MIIKTYIVVPIILILLVVLFLSYSSSDKLVSKDTLKGNIYLLQQGVYSNTDVIEKLGVNHITVKEGNKFYAYIGMTTDIEIANKIKELYNEKNIPVYIKEDYTNSEELISELEQYDVLLKNANGKEEIDNILETVLSTYEEVMSSE